MRRISLLLGVCALLGFARSARAEDDGLRCGNRLVSVGALAAEVRALCGEPVASDRRTVVVPVCDRNGNCPRALTIEAEEWTYEREGELIRTLRFIKGALASVRVGPRPDPARCERQLFSEQTTTSEVLAACGEPAQIDHWTEDRLIGTSPDPAHRKVISVQREQWVYNFGPDRFLRIFLFENGALFRQTTGSYGF